MDHWNTYRGRKGRWEKSQSLSNPLEPPWVRGSLRDLIFLFLLLYFVVVFFWSHKLRSCEAAYKKISIPGTLEFLGDYEGRKSQSQ